MTEYEILSLLGACREFVESSHFSVTAPEHINKKFVREDDGCLDLYVMLKELDKLIDMLVEPDVDVVEVFSPKPLVKSDLRDKLTCTNEQPNHWMSDKFNLDRISKIDKHMETD